MPLEVEINRYKEYLEAAVTDLNGTDMFLEYDWLIKHNPEVDWKDSKIKFTRCLDSYRMKHQDIKFKTWRIWAIEILDKNKSDIGKKSDPINPEDLLDYI